MAILRTRREMRRQLAATLLARSIAALTVLSLIAQASLPALGQDFSVEESRIKAGLLFNFAKFINWPGSQNAPQSKLVFCVVGDAGVAKVLKTEAAGKMVADRQVVIEELMASSHVEHCQLIFLSDREKNAVAILARTRELPTVTVGEDPHFLRRGGIINLVREDGRFNFEIGLGTATRAGVSISAKLLQLAREVIKGVN